MSAVFEKVFIAWGGNQELAQDVAAKLGKYQYDGIVGGGQVTDMYLGAQIFAQIRQSTQAVILVQQVADGDKYNFNDNMMFEWGYLTARMQPNKVHVFLIDLSVSNLPSDLMGTWATEVTSYGRNMDEVSDEIARIFYANASRPVEMDKMKIMRSWDRTKQMMEAYNDEPRCSDIEMAHILLHSMESCYQYAENDYAEEMLNKIIPISNILRRVIALFKAMISLAKETEHFTKPVSYDTYEEIKAVCEAQIDFSEKDDNLNRWFRFHQENILSMLLSSLAIQPDFDEGEKNEHIEKAVQHSAAALEMLNEILSLYPKEKEYTNLFKGYLHGSMRHHGYGEVGNAEKAAYHSQEAVTALKAFYLAYKDLYPLDSYLNNRFAQVYYLNLARHYDYASPEEVTGIKRTLASFSSKHLQKAGHHDVYLKLKEKVGRILETETAGGE